MIDDHTPLVDVAFKVCTALHNAGIEAVLCGGSAAEFYTPREYRSYDADFVVKFGTDPEVVITALATLEFEPRGNIFAHPHSPYTVEFPRGPLGVGSDIIEQWETVARGAERLYVVSRTDSVRDRLAAYYFWEDFDSLKVAIAVARSGPIDLELIERWSAKEDASEKFATFQKALSRMPETQ